MRKEKRKIPVYSNGTTELYEELLVQVDDAGEEWLTPEQIVYLEDAHLRAQYQGSNAFKASDKLTIDYETPIPVLQPTVTNG